MATSLQSNNRKTWRILWLLSTTLFMVSILMPLVRHGMFLDGVTYAAIAKNLSLNHGTLWQPYYSETLFPVFYEHPPFAIFLESLCFRVLGEQCRVENLYSFFIIATQLSLIAWYWLRKEKVSWHHFALLLLVWLLVPLNTRVFTNNMLEATLTLFTTAASLLLLCPAKNKWGDWFYLFGASIAMLLGYLSNGPTAFFPIAIPMLLALVQKPTEGLISGVKRSGQLLVMTLCILLVFYLLLPAAWDNTQHYLQTQVMPSVTGERLPVHTNMKHAYVIYLYLRAAGLVAVFAVICLVIAAKLQQRSIGQNLKQAFSQPAFLFFFYLSLIASLPVGVSHKQAFNYIAQCAPFIVLAGLYLCHKPCLIIMSHGSKSAGLLRVLQDLSLAGFVMVMLLTISSGSKFNRDEALLKDLPILLPKLQQAAIVSTSQAVAEQWVSAAYFSRFSMISLEQSERQTYYLALKNESLPNAYQVVTLPLHYYTLGILRTP